ncbi:MAG: putative LPS assembly protein LptD [Flavobacteriales bacterium]|nr:putative LPS assembly protein LptD [Flavobacteriales bacterium]
MSAKSKHTLFLALILWILAFSETSAQQTLEDTTSTKSSFLTSDITYFAEDSSVVDLQGKKVRLYHKAQVNYEDIELQAEHIVLNWENNTVFAIGQTDSTGHIFGEPIFKEKGKTYYCESILYNFKSKKGKIKGMRTQDGEGYIHGDHLKKQADNSMFIEESKYTTCSDEDPHFYIRAKKLKIIPNNKIVTGPANLVIADIPTPLFVPFGFFPMENEKSSGFLMPSYGNSTNRGYYFRNGGWYFSINDHVDLALRGDIYTRGSWKLKSQSVYKKRYAYKGNFSISYSKNLLGEKGLSNFQDQRDFFINWTHTQDPKAHPNRRFSAKVNAGSSSFNRMNAYLGNDYLKNTLTSNVSYSYSWIDKPFNLSANLRHSQNTLNNSISLSLPDLGFNVNRIHPFKRKQLSGKQRWYEKISMSYNVQAKNQIETIDSLLFTSQTLKNMRYGIKHRVPISSSFKVFKHFNLSPGANYTERWYFDRIEKSWNEDQNILHKDTVGGVYAVRDFNTSIRLNTKVYGLYPIKSKRIKAIRHVISPSISFNYRPDFSDEKWGYYDRTVVDSLGNEQMYSYYNENIYNSAPMGKSGNISVSVDNNLEMKIKSKNDSITEYKKIALFKSLSFRGNYNLAVDSFNLSNINFSGRSELIPKLNIKFSGSLNPYQMNENGNQIHKYVWKDKPSLGRLTNFNFSVNWSFKSSYQPTTSKVSQNIPEEQWNMIQDYADDYVDFNIPWDISMDYKYSYRKPMLEKSIRQTFNVRGNVRLTEKWKIGFRSGYDFDTQEISYTSLDFYRDLHCWELRFNWIPFGYHQSYNLSINVKSSILQDLKLNKRMSFLDF